MNIWICDDEKEITETIAAKVKIRFPSAEIQKFCFGTELLKSESHFDILFLDIELLDMNGIEVAMRLRERGEQGSIIFVTAHEKYIFQAFDVQAFHYLVKPFDNQKFFKILQDAVKQRHFQSEEAPYIIIKTGYELYKVFHAEILFIEVMGRKITVHTKSSAYTYNGKLQDLENSLGQNFYRIHRSFLVHLKYVASYDKQSIVLDNDISLTLSQKKYTDFIQQYLQYIKRKGYVST